MPVITQPLKFKKTGFSDLQGAWTVLRYVALQHQGPNADKILYYIDEAMNWESVRNLQRMKASFLHVQNLAVADKAGIQMLEAIEDVRQLLTALS